MKLKTRKSSSKAVTNSSFKEISAALIDARKQANFTLENAARLARVSEKFAHALESSKGDLIEHSVYTRGKLGSYAKAVGANQNEILRIYDEVFGVVSDKPVRTGLKKPHTFITTRAIVVSVFGAFGILTLGYLGLQAFNLSSAPALEVLYPMQDINVYGSTLNIRGQSTKGSIISINGAEAPLAADGSFEFEIGLHDGVNIVFISSKNKLGREATVERTVVARTTQENAHLPEDNNGRIYVEISISDEPVSLSITTDETSEFEGYILAGNTMIVSALELVEIQGLNEYVTLRYINNATEVRDVEFDKNTTVVFDSISIAPMLE